MQRDFKYECMYRRWHTNHKGRQYDHILNENGTLYTTSIGSGSSTNIGVDNTTIKQYANGTIYAVGGGSATSSGISSISQDGQILEELFLCAMEAL